MSRPHLHSSTAETQNQGNSLGERACIRQSKLFRTHESGNTMKGLLGCDNLAWKTNVSEGAYAGRSTYDHNNPYQHSSQSSSSYGSQESVRESQPRHSHERSYAHDYNRDPPHHQSMHSQHHQPRERSHHDHHKESRYEQHEHESAHQSTALAHRNTHTITSTITTTSNTRTMDDPRLRALAEQRVLAAVAASQVIAMGPQGRQPPSIQPAPLQGQRNKSSLDYSTNMNREHPHSSYKQQQPQASASTRPW